jgi:hypothetical protein
MGAVVETAKELKVEATSRAETESGRKGIGGANATPSVDKRAWTLKGIRCETVMQSRKAAQTQGMLLSLWVEKQLREAAERELQGSGGKLLAADLMCEKMENIESALRDYLKDQDKRIADLHKEIRNLNDNIVPTLLKVLSTDRPRKRA